MTAAETGGLRRLQRLEEAPSEDHLEAKNDGYTMELW